VDDIHVVCCCLKDYLLNLKECLLTSSLRTAFINAAGNQQFKLQCMSSNKSHVLSTADRICSSFAVNVQYMSQREHLVEMSALNYALPTVTMRIRFLLHEIGKLVCLFGIASYWTRIIVVSLV